MKKIFLILFLTPGMFLLHAQQVNFDWAKQMEGTGPTDARGLSIATDAFGNIYMTGFFTGTVDFDPGQGVHNLVPFGDEELYISKLDSSGNLLWAKQMDATPYATSSKGRAIAIDASGYIYVTGEFLDAGNRLHCFASKLDNAGNFIWTKQIGESSKGTSIKADASGDVYIAGLFNGFSDFDPGPGIFIIGSFGNRGFVSKLDSQGNFVWAKEIVGYVSGNGVYGGITDDISMALDASGNVCISGAFYGIVDFDPGAGLFQLTSAGILGGADIFILKLDRAGNFVWARQMGGIGNEISVSINIDASGNIYTSGNFNGTADFDPGAGTFNLSTGNGNSGIFVSKLDNNGNFIWAKQLVGGLQLCYSITLDNTGNIFMTGYFGSTLDFDPGPGTYNLSTTGYDIFILKLNGDGNFVWAKQMGGTASVISNSIAIDAVGNVYTTGYFLTGLVDFDPGAGTYNLTAGDGDNIFVQKLSQCLKNSSSALAISACKTYTLNGQSYNSSGIYAQTLTNAAGCDSVIILNLTINFINELVDATACAGFTLNNHTYTASGTYTDTLSTTGGCDSVITLHLTITSPLPAIVSQSICAGQSFYGHTASGTYIDTLVAVNGCDSIRMLQLTVLPKPTPYLGEDTSLCIGDSLQLYPGKFATYTWQDGSVKNHLTVKKPGLYSVTVTDNCNSAKDDIIIKERICDIYFPTAFTPNNDGKNDLFKIQGANNLVEYHLSVYNRWGQEVFKSFDYSKGWDGRFNERTQSAQIFVWYCEFKKQGDRNKIKMKGIVTLIN